MYVDDGIVFSLDRTSIDSAIKEFKDSKIKLEEQGHPADYVGVNINSKGDGSYDFTQPALTQKIIKDVRLGPRATPKPIPVCSQILLWHHLDSPPQDESKFQYQYVIGKLNYLAQYIWPNIFHALHQCAHFSSNPRKEHIDAMEYIARYLKGTSDLGLISSLTSPRVFSVLMMTIIVEMVPLIRQDGPIHFQLPLRLDYHICRLPHHFVI